MNLLKDTIIKKIQSEGPITFETFMDMALYQPGLGYYASADRVIGRKGDFYTSSHLHPIFGAMIAEQLMEMWRILGRPDNFHAIEIGSGAGYLCKDTLDYLQRSSGEAGETADFIGCFNYVIVEMCTNTQKRQKELLGSLRGKVKWVKSLGELSHMLKGCMFSNELPDAFPVHLVQMHDRLKEVYVNLRNGDFIEEIQDVSSPDLIEYMKRFSARIPQGYRTEINLRIRDWLKEISSVLSEGFLLTVDYGYTAKEYYAEERTRGTLLCYHNHRINDDPYVNIGNQDITAHVNFSSLKKWGEETGFKTAGYCTQGTFLISSGIDEVITELYSDSPDYSYEISRIKGLILPQGMGETHKVMVQYKGEGLPGLRGFTMRNEVESL